jgi:sterol-4alpha-carboxylate 3-dehydrogenase (decarboxylating)
MRDALPRRNVPRKVPTARTAKSYLVIGGHGFLGSHIVEALLARGEQRIRVLDVAPSPLFRREIDAGQVRFVAGDVRDAARVREACQGVDTVFHTVAALDFWSDLPFEYDAIHAVNVTGTENVIAACVDAAVGQLLYTSSASVVVPHTVLEHPLHLADESVPYASAPFLCHYIETKGLAERAVLAAGRRGGLATAALRPGALFGPRDRVLTAAVAAGLPGIGLGDNIIDHIYIENVAHAFLLLEASLAPGSPTCGQAYFVTGYTTPPGDERERTYLDFYRRLSAGFGRGFRLAPASLLSAIAMTSQALVRISRGRLAPYLGELRKLRPASLALARGTYYFTHQKASDDFGYRPLYSLAEAIEITAAHVRPSAI